LIAIVPARGGSKGIPGKNIKIFCGKPLIYYTISEALKSKLITEIIISTDSLEIAETAKGFGAKCPFIRPSELATDNAKAIDNYIYTVKKLNDDYNYSEDEFIVLQPTSPLRTVFDIDNAINLFIEKSADSVISVTEFDHPIEWAKIIESDGRLRNYFQSETNSNLNRQELQTSYRPNGAIFVFKFELLFNNYSYYSENTFGYKMSSENSIDIDTELDFEFAEYIMRKRNNECK